MEAGETVFNTNFKKWQIIHDPGQVRSYQGCRHRYEKKGEDRVIQIDRERKKV